MFGGKPTTCDAWDHLLLMLKQKMQIALRMCTQNFEGM